jgi:small subunit ribosomal protein S20
LPNLKSSKKDMIRSRRRRVRNQAWKSRVKTAVRSAREAIAGEDQTVATEATRTACRLLDKAATKGAVHRRQAVRRKARLARRLAKAASA